MLMGRAVAEGVRHALGHDSQEPEQEVRSIAAAIDGLGVGMGAIFEDDHALL